jgi:hypothetical protein
VPVSAIPSHELPGLAPGAVWIIGASRGPLSRFALDVASQADVAVVDAQAEPALGGRWPATCRVERSSGAAAERCQSLARAGWRVLRIVPDDAGSARQAVDEAALLRASGTPSRLLLVMDDERGHDLPAPADPLGFSMSGIAG